MNAKRALRRLGGTLAVAGLAVPNVACPDDRDPTGSGDDGAALVVLETPGTDEGALLFTLHGAEPFTIEAASANHQIFSRELPGGATRVAVIGNLADGVVLKLTIGGSAADYEATLEQVADRQNNLRPSLSSYELLIEPVGQ